MEKTTTEAVLKCFKIDGKVLAGSLATETVQRKQASELSSGIQLLGLVAAVNSFH